MNQKTYSWNIWRVYDWCCCCTHCNLSHATKLRAYRKNRGDKTKNLIFIINQFTYLRKILLIEVRLMDDAKEVEMMNNRFYEAFESLSIDKMEEVWSHKDNTVCVHPGWDLFTGWLAIRESWIRIFQNTDSMKFVITNTKIRIIDNIAIVVCLENIESVIDGKRVKFGILATNIFERQKDKWLMIHHHGSTVSNYLPPIVSSN